MGFLSDFFLARQLRKGPTLLLPYIPDPAAVLETVRLHAPEAGPYGDGLKAGDNVWLRGPIALTPELAAKAGIPLGWQAAYVAGNIDDETGGGYDLPMALTAGLAERLKGQVHPREPEPPADLAEVTGGRPVPVADLVESLADELPGLTARAVAEGVTLLTCEGSPVEILVEEDEDETGYTICVDDGVTGPGLIGTARRAALVIAGRGGGIARDHNGFLIRETD
ncbi:hypothetical protein [Microtetraspora niveoalba]|uniref:hypothetical protein n=1 Tax=Microtetraspora niveoalba TaxID=46175 RepID=UPI00082FBB53|nr:hypothetical protein [Microtetraspora niveoalba]